MDCPAGPPSEKDEPFHWDFTGDETVAWNQRCQEIQESMQQQQEEGAINELLLTSMALWIQGGYCQLPQWPTSTVPISEERPRISVSVDGAVELGNRPWAAMGTWGSYWPHGEAEDLDQHLQGKGFTEAYLDGCIGCGQALGPALSSTRMEAMAIYAGLAIPGALHIELDNQSAARRARRLIRKGAPRKPWGMQPDGDIWQAIHANLAGRGTGAILVSKLKGHATAQDVLEGRCTEAQRRGNDASDVAAGAAKPNNVRNTTGR